MQLLQHCMVKIPAENLFYPPKTSLKYLCSNDIQQKNPNRIIRKLFYINLFYTSLREKIIFMMKKKLACYEVKNLLKRRLFTQEKKLSSFFFNINVKYEPHV